MYDYEREAEMAAEDIYNGCDPTEHYEGYWSDLGEELTEFYPEFPHYYEDEE